MRMGSVHIAYVASGDALDPEMEPDTTQQESQEAAEKQEEEDEEEADPAVLAKKQKQLAKRGVTFEAKVDPKVSLSQHLQCNVFHTTCLQTAPDH